MNIVTTKNIIQSFILKLIPQQNTKPEVVASVIPIMSNANNRKDAEGCCFF